MRGEHQRTFVRIVRRRGSSPHAWGTHDTSTVKHLERRFIPTCVGNTWCRGSSSIPESVHPHMRGEHIKGREIKLCELGSSPHAWGTLRSGADSIGKRRFIPTCVGNTRAQCHFQLPTPVHPHMRGEHINKVIHNLSTNGSSPHAWGTQMNLICTKPLLRFIPTCVGNTLYLLRYIASRLVHPHMRGEHLITPPQF